LSNYINYKIFFKKRISKVLIPYYVIITFIFIFNLLIPLFSDGLYAYLSHIFLYKMFIEKYEGSFGGQFWFISTIIQFYLIYPLLVKAVNKYNSLLCLLSGIIISLTYSIVISLKGYGDVRVVNSFFIQYLWEFVLGMVVAKENLIGKLINLKWYSALMLAIAGYSIMAILVLEFGDFGRNINDIFSFIGYISMSVFVYNIAKIYKNVMLLIQRIEPISYPLFLTHTFVYVLCVKYLFSQITLIYIPVVFLIALIVANLVNMLLNRVYKTPKGKTSIQLIP